MSFQGSTDAEPIDDRVMTSTRRGPSHICVGRSAWDEGIDSGCGAGSARAPRRLVSPTKVARICGPARATVSGTVRGEPSVGAGGRRAKGRLRRARPQKIPPQLFARGVDGDEGYTWSRRRLTQY
jgi:hypothetical protein